MVIRPAISLIGLLGLALLIAACGAEAPKLQKGQPVPAFSLVGLDGRLVSVPDGLGGQVLAVRFWADWCPFCEQEMRDLEPVYETLKPEGLEVLAINVRQSAATAAAFVEPLGVTYPVLLDRDGAVARDYGVSGLPVTFILDRQGRLAARILGESTPEIFETLVREQL